jgi:hypothetical protein
MKNRHTPPCGGVCLVVLWLYNQSTDETLPALQTNLSGW